MVTPALQHLPVASPIVNSAGALDYRFATFFIHFLIMLLIVRFYTKFRGNSLFEGTMAWLRPAVVGLIGAAAIILIVRTTWTSAGPAFQIVEENFPDWKSWLLLGAAFAGSYWGKISPILLIVAGAVAGMLLW